MATHDQIVSAYESYLVENESFETKNVKAAAARARKALGQQIHYLTKNVFLFLTSHKASIINLTLGRNISYI